MEIEKKIFYDVAMIMFKVIKCKLPKWVYTFPEVRDLRRQGTRQTNSLIVPRVKTKIGARAITSRGPRCWNNLPASIRETESVPPFKEKLKKYLLDEARENFR